ncbi:uncharacterized protein N7529_007582 [Penicillium soppii]|uniref:uncharacterized protein n=1 Tax=Penicillium soppii TaxID=69789 RepID=UPI002547636B|nr:uncharacterized protein N7529_007582 [Penicillium soppii]KAJ5860272.1 hypothetical protein N7529_007582 [Penicillium soppii]
MGNSTTEGWQICSEVSPLATNKHPIGQSGQQTETKIGTSGARQRMASSKLVERYAHGREQTRAN